MLEKKGPSFLGIGAPRAGTTWLYSVLRLQNGVWMPPIKELHYFDSIDPHLSFNRKTHLLVYRLYRFGFIRFAHYILYFISEIAKLPLLNKHPYKIDVQFDRAFFSLGSDILWYNSLFNMKESQGCVTGEFTPDYALINKDVATLLSSSNTDLKIIMMFRDPVERTWSNAVFYVTRKLKLKPESLSIDDWLSYCFRKECLERSNYIKMYNMISSVVQTNRLFIGYYDEIIENPELLIGNILSFLGVNSSSNIECAQLKQSINASAKIHMPNIPDEVRLKLMNYFLRDLLELNSKLENPFVQSWIDEYKECLGQF
jgi:hypothetical protein